jgi:serine phosphatase RsbU (regulator of sigma subunit)/TPR repeat protein
MKHLVFTYLILFSSFFFAQDQEQIKKIELLKAKIQSCKNDSIKIDLLTDYEMLVFDENFNLAISLDKQVLEICDKNLKKNEKQKFYLVQKSLAFNNLGLLYQFNGEIKKSLYYFKEGLKIDILLGNEPDIGASYTNIGSVYDYLGDYIQAIEYFQKSLKIQIKTKNKRGQSDIYNNFGVIYNSLDQKEKAFEYYFKSLKLDRELNDKQEESITLSNIGNLHGKKKDFSKALYYTKVAHELQNKYGNELGQANTAGNIGSFYLDLNKIDSAEYYTLKAISIFRKSDNQQGLGTYLPYLAKIRNLQNRNSEAEKLGKEAFDFAQKTGDRSSLNKSAFILFEIYKSLGDFKKALFYFEKYIEAEKSIQNDENRKQLLSFEFDKKTSEENLKNAESIKLKNKEISFEQEKNASFKQKISFLLFGLFLMLILLFIIYNRFKVTKRQKGIIELQKIESDNQKRIIELINNEVNSSINYAKMIQDAVFPAYNFDDIFDDSFLFALPRDVVSGDFYWLESDKEKKYFAVADCTGHGIPGAFISMIGTILLNEIYNSKKIIRPDLILNELSRLVKLTLMSKDQNVLNDGMDISFCTLDKNTNELNYSGANNPIYILSKNNSLLVNSIFTEPKSSLNDICLYKIDADKRPIGKSYSQSEDFSLKSIQLMKGDFVLLMSDGFVDQFGGEKSDKGGKKYKAKNLENFLLEKFKLSGEELKSCLATEFYQWKGDLDQVDDVCLLGVWI